MVRVGGWELEYSGSRGMVGEVIGVGTGQGAKERRNRDLSHQVVDTGETQGDR